MYFFAFIDATADPAVLRLWISHYTARGVLSAGRSRVILDVSGASSLSGARLAPALLPSGVEVIEAHGHRASLAPVASPFASPLVLTSAFIGMQGAKLSDLLFFNHWSYRLPELNVDSILPKLMA